MSYRPATSIVADVRNKELDYTTWRAAVDEAADELERSDGEHQQRLDRMNDEWNDDRIRLRELDALRPPCPTCGGTHRVRFISGSSMTDEGPVLYEKDCPDCLDGKMSWEWTAELATEFIRLAKEHGWQLRNMQGQTLEEKIAAAEAAHAKMFEPLDKAIREFPDRPLFPERKIDARMVEMMKDRWRRDFPS